MKVRAKRAKRFAVEHLEIRNLLSATAEVGPLASDHPAWTKPAQVAGLGESPAVDLERGPGLVKRVEAIDRSTIRVQLKSPLTARQAAQLRAEIPGLEVKGVKVAQDRRSALIATSPQGKATYQVQVSLPHGAIGSGTFRSKVGSQAVEVTPLDENSLLVQHARPMSKVAAKAASYTITDPRIADADFDGLADGAEFQFQAGATIRSDPHKADTDGDGRDDRLEKAGTLNPLVPDDLVTVSFVSLTITVDSDVDGAGPGDIRFGLGIRKPDSGAAFGLDADWTSVINQGLQIIGPRRSESNERYDYGSEELPPEDNNYTPHWDSERGAQFTKDDTLHFATYAGDGRSPTISFVVARDERFSIEGVIEESDYDRWVWAGNPNAPRTQFYLGGVDGLLASEERTDAAGEQQSGALRTVFRGSDLTLNAIRDLYFDFDSNNRDTTTRIGDAARHVAGKLRVVYSVS